ncbi:alkaline phosphatase PhoX [Nitratifractor sp.]|uniref:PhoX family protein n=1 Tax=Nitratifractor sp. TaxID=2268144 RepID=UPI0025FD160D|nr:alkaline phosphatase PhoX [Nitratifractor sp.]
MSFPRTLLASSLLLSSLLAAQGADTDRFAGKQSSIAYPVTDTQKRAILVAPQMELPAESGTLHPLRYKTVLNTGETLGSEIFGLLKDVHGKPLRMEDGSYYICNGQFGGSGPDHTEFILVDGKPFMVTQFECGIGAIYVAPLKQDPQTGELSAEGLRFVSQAEYHGGWVHCAGMKTPWNSFLGSEEYEPDARKLDPATGKLEGDEFYDGKAPYFGGDLKQASPYYYGWITELKILNAKGETRYTKHYSMGRFAHELAYVMPDAQTAYLSDDGTNCALFMYRADKKNDLSAGTLYAAKWKQTSDANGGKADLEWIPLGHATDAEIRAIVKQRPLFNDIFETAKPQENGNCPAGFASVNTRTGHECLKVKPGMDKAAAFLESRRYAALKGATTEFRKMEGLSYDPDQKRLYVAISQIAKGMEDRKKYGKPNPKYDVGGPNDIRLPVNKCGGVYAMDIAPHKKDSIGKDLGAYATGNMYAVITGVPMKYPEGSPFHNKYNKCDINGIANPDNISYLPGSHTLLIGEDTGSHQNDLIWAFDTKKGALSARVASTPYGSETTSVMWRPDLNGRTYINFVTQHPFGESDQDKLRDPREAQSHVGYIQVK